MKRLTTFSGSRARSDEALAAADALHCKCADLADFFNEHGASKEDVEAILKAIKDDQRREKLGGKRKFPDPDKFVEAGGDLLKLRLPTVKTLGRSNLADLNLLTTSYAAAGIKPSSVFERKVAV